MTVRQLAGRDRARWRAATHHPFLDGVRDGSLSDAAFNRWLEQDRLFVETLARAWARLLVTAPAADLALLSEGIGAFVAELHWLEEVAVARRLTGPAEPLPATTAYQAHLLRVAREPFPIALTAMWAVEAAYLDAWRTARPGAPEYRAFVEHWTDDGFSSFVDGLELAADRALAAQPAAVLDAAFDALRLTADHEAAFWAMTWTPTPSSPRAPQTGANAPRSA